MRRYLTTLFAGLAAAASPALAQYSSLDMTGAMMATANVQIGNAMVCSSSAACRAERDAGRARKRPARAALDAQAGPADLSFAVDPRVRREARKTFRAAVKAFSPELYGMIGGVDHNEAVGERIAALGLDPNDLAVTTAIALLIAHDTVHGADTLGPTGTQGAATVRRIVANLRPVIALSPGLAEADDAALQERSDLMTGMAFFFAATQYGLTEGDPSPAMTAEVVGRVLTLSKALFGVDLQLVELSGDRFVPRDPDAFAARYALAD